ncbi:MAG: deoxyribodipyrimidine photo-lyase [Candidatus Izemoplasmatales bacterium]
MENGRVLHLIKRSAEQKGSYVLYFLQQAQRYAYNHALEFAIQKANQSNQELICFFGLTSNYPEANLRHYQFMIEGLVELSVKLREKGIRFDIVLASPEVGILPYLKEASTVIFDIGYTKIQRYWRKEIYHEIMIHHPSVDLYSVETDSIIPVKIASDKEEYGAYTIRNKLHKQLPNFTSKVSLPLINKQSNELKTYSVSDLLSRLELDKTIQPSPIYHGGYTEAKKQLDLFIQYGLPNYLLSNDPSSDFTSKMSMYLHFGQISSLEIYHHILESNASEENKNAYIEQLLVRRELANNYIFYNHHYDTFGGITEKWAYLTMSDHLEDKRAYLYTVEDYTEFNTHDPYFNAAMKQMVYTGYMHNYMRMYWAKKIIEWSPSYEIAYENIKKLNNTYFLDGRDALSFTGIAWCFGKHDRPWTEREIFGKLRYMNDSGLRRKFNIEEYVLKMNQLEQSILNGTQTTV